MQGLKTEPAALVMIPGHSFIQNRRHYELGTESSHPHLRIASAFEELTETI